MATRASTVGARRRRPGPPSGSLLGFVALSFVALLLASDAQRRTPSGEEVYIDRLGCWNCHGDKGNGGAGRSIAKTQLPLRTFLSYVRLPSAEMPPFAPLLASDEELAIVYRWLDGVEVVKIPLPLTVSLTSSQTGASGSEVLVSARPSDASLEGDAPNHSSVQYRVTLRTAANAPLAQQPFEFQPAGRADWSTFTTNEQGEALLGPDTDLVSTATSDNGKEAASSRLRAALTAGRYALVVEALDRSTPGTDVVVGVATTVLRVQ